MDSVTQKATNGNGRKTWRSTGKPHELKDARPGDTVMVEDRKYVIGRDGRLYRVA